MRAGIPVLNEEGAQRQVHSGDPAVVCLLRRAQAGSSWVLSVINIDLHNPHDFCIAGLDSDTIVGREVTPGSSGQTATVGDVLKLAPGEARIFVNA